MILLMPLSICFDVTFMKKLFIDFKHFIFYYQKIIFLTLDIFHELIIIVEYILSNYLFIYLCHETITNH